MVNLVPTNFVPPGMWAWVPLPGKIFVRPEHLTNTWLIAHEIGHIRQWEELGWKFLPTYLWQWVKGGFKYKNIKMEREADEMATVHFEEAARLIERYRDL